MDKAARVGIRIADLLDREVFEEKLERNLAEKNRLFEKIYETEGFTKKKFLMNILNMDNSLNSTSAILLLC